RIRREIVESPYKIRDIGSQVIAEPPEENAGIVPFAIEEDIKQILGTIIRTTIAKDELEDELTDATLDEKIAVSFQPLLGRAEGEDEPQADSAIPIWIYGIIALFVMLIIAIILFFNRKRRLDELRLEEELNKLRDQQQVALEIPEIDGETETEDTIRLRRIEKLAKEKPEELVKL